MNFTSKLPDASTTIFTVMSKLAHKHNAINLAQGFPGFGSDPALHTLVTKAMEGGYNQYAPMAGVFSFRESITNKIIFTIVSAFIHPGDEVIILKPAYDCYEPAVEVNGGKVVPIQLKAPDYKVNWKAVENAITPKTRMLFINTPHNPTGTILEEDDMLELQCILEGTNIILLSDEVYEHMVFDGKRHESIARYPELRKRSFITASFGKTFHTTGWKMGYAVGPKELMKEFQKVHQYNVFSVHHPSQIALASYLNESKVQNLKQRQVREPIFKC